MAERLAQCQQPVRESVADALPAPRVDVGCDVVVAQVVGGGAGGVVPVPRGVELAAEPVVAVRGVLRGREERAPARKLKEYILRFHGETLDPEAYLFYSKIKGTHTKTTARAIQKRVKELAAKAHETCEEVPLDPHPHNYRHAYGTRRIRQGKQIAVVQREMGHRCIQSTMTYIDTSSMMEQAQEAAESEEVRKIKPVWKPGDSLQDMYRSRFMT